MQIQITPMELVRSILFDAEASGLTLSDVCEAARHSDCLWCMDDAVAMLGIGAINPGEFTFIEIDDS